MKSILVIDDDPLIRKTLSSHLTKDKFEVHMAEDGSEGLEKYDLCNPDLVILDIRLPDMDGLEALRFIKEKNKNATIIIMTAYDDMKTTVDAIKLGAFEYLVKPLDHVELDLTIDKAIQVQNLEDKLSYLVEEKEWPTGSSETLSGEGLVTFGADGTFLGEFTVDFGADHPARFKSAKHGTWKQTGPRELTLTLLGFDYGQEEDNPNLVFGPENRVTGTIRIINTISFEEDFEKFSEEGSVEIFLAVDRADPLDPNAEPSIGPFRHSATGRRIRAPL